MIALRSGLLSVGFFLSMQLSAQKILIEVDASGTTTTLCPIIRTNSITATLKDAGGNTIATNAISGASVTTSGQVLTFEINAATWNGSITLTGQSMGTQGSPMVADCNRIQSATTTQLISFAGGTCTSATLSTIGNKYAVSGTVNFYSMPDAPTGFGGTATCGATSVNLSVSDGGSSFHWQVSEDAVNWTTIRNSASSSITATIDELTPSGFTTSRYHNRFVRVIDTGCSGKRVGSSTVAFKFLAAAPTATFLDTDPKCHDGADGTVQVNITGASPINDFVVTAFKGVYPAGVLIQQKDLTDEFTTTITGLSAGVNYWIRIENSTSIGQYGSCSRDYTITPLDNPATISVDFETSNHGGYALSCKGGNNATLKAIPTGGSGTYTEYTWTPNVSTTNLASNLTEQTYKVKVKDNKGCLSEEFSKAIDAPGALNISLSSTGGKGAYEVSCWNKTDGAVASSTTGGVPAYSYLWTTGAVTSGLSSRGTGTYSVTVTDANGCTDTESITLRAPSAIDFSIHELTPVECPQSPNPTGSLVVQSVVNNIGEISYLWASGEQTSTITNKGAGTYTVTVSDAQGCSTEKSRSLAAPPGYTVQVSPTSGFNGSYISCAGKDDGALKAEVRDPGGALVPAQDYEWYKDGDAYENGLTLNSIDDLEKGTYKVVVTYGAGCKADHTYVLNDPGPVTPVISISSNHNGVAISCPGASDGSLHAAGSGGTGSSYTFVWGNGTTGADLTGKGAGTYTVTAKDVNGCEGVASRVLSDPPPINPTISIVSAYNGLPVKCHNATDGKLHVSVTGGAGLVTYVWSTGDTGTDLDNIGAGSYTVEASDANGCSMTSPSKTVINPDPVVASISTLSDFNGQAIKCHNASDGSVRASASGGTNSFTYAWNTGATGADLTGIPAGTYTVTARDMNGCSDTESKTLDNPTLVEASIDDFSDYNGYGVHCKTDNDGFIEASGQGGTGRYTYLWMETSETTFRASDLAAGTYTVKVSDTNGCWDDATHEITEPDVVTLSLADRKNLLCHGASDGALEVFASGGVSGYEYSINATDWQSGPEFTGLRGAIPYTITATDLNGCTEELTETLTQPQQLDISFTVAPAFCADPRGSATAAVTGGVGGYTYAWTDHTGTALSSTSSITDKPAGVYTLLIHDANSCPLTETVGISSTDGPQVVVKEVVSASCSYSSDGSGLLEVTGGDGPFQFLWPDGQTTIQGLNFAKGSYQVVITDRNDCITVTPVEIPAPEVLDISTVETIMPDCHGDCNGSIKVESRGGVGSYTYDWGTQTGAEAKDLCMGDHTVTVTDGNGCTLTENFHLAQPEVLQLRLLDRTLPLCNGSCNGSIEVEASGGNGHYQFAWSSGSTTGVAVNICAGDHTVKVADGKNCTIERTISLGQPEPLQVNLLRNLSPVCHDGCNGALEVQAYGGTGSYHYRWNTEATTAVIESLCPADYRVTINDDNACAISKTYTIENPPALVVDLGDPVTLCVGQTHVLDAGAAWTKYAWGGNTGFTANTSAVTIKEAGQYWVELHNSDNCIAKDTFLLQTSVDLLKANFFVTTEAMAGDTVVIVDVSWPLPDHTTWEYPAAMNKIFDSGDVIFGQFNNEGSYEIKLNARLGQCYDSLTKTITILKGEEDIEGGRLGYVKFVKEFDMYPNPTDGNFDVSVELAEESPITLSVWNGGTSLFMGKVQDSGKKYYLMHFDLRPLSSGTYILRLDHKNGKEYIRFIAH